MSTEVAERDFERRARRGRRRRGLAERRTRRARLLGRRAARVRAPGRIVEIGSFRGRSTIVLRARGRRRGRGRGDRSARRRRPRAAGDHARRRSAASEDHRAFHANLERAGVDGGVRHVRRMSEDALGEVEAPIDLLYVDGAHRYAPARADIERWGDARAARRHACWSTTPTTRSA